MIQQSKINSFIKSITDSAAEKRAAVGEETEQILKAERAAMEQSAEKSADSYVRTKSASIRLEAGRKISESAAECRKEVFARRNEIAKATFSKAAEKLQAFTAGAEYEKFLSESAARVIEVFGGGRVTLLLRPEDMAFGEKLCADYPDASFSKDSTIKIGGLKGINSLATLLIDDTLDSRLESQKKWFEENSGLYISMR